MKKLLKNFSYMILAVCAVLSLTMHFAPCSSNLITPDSSFLKLLSNITLSIKNSSFLISILTPLFFYISIKFKTVSLPSKPIFVFFSFFLSFLWLLTKGLTHLDPSSSLNIIYITTPHGQLLKSIIYLIGYFWIIYTSTKLFYTLLTIKNKNNFFFQSTISTIKIKHKYLLISFILVICWMPYMILIWPANLMIDTWIGFNDFYGIYKFSRHNPLFFVILMHWFYLLGDLLGSVALGLYIYHLIQFILSISIITYSFKFIFDLKSPNWIVILYFLILISCPYYINSVDVIIKDLPYSMCFLLFMIELILWIRDKNIFLNSKLHSFLFFISILGIYTFRLNGKYILIPTLSFYIIYLIYHKNIISTKSIKKFILLTIFPILIGSSIDLVIMSSYDTIPISRADRLSMQLQQTARFVKVHPELITDSEKKIISSILDYPNISKNYDPIIADKIRSVFYQNTSNKNIILYLLTWFKMFFKSPETYLLATLHQNYLLFYPFQENDTAYTDYMPPLDSLTHPLFELKNFSTHIPFKNLKELHHEFIMFLYSTPIIGCLSTPSIYIILTLLLILIALVKKIFDFILVTIPILLTLGVCLLAPVVYQHPRYSFPIIYSFIILLSYLAAILQQKLDPSSKL